jgi:hypothetical protein
MNCRLDYQFVKALTFLWLLGHYSPPDLRSSAEFCGVWACGPIRWRQFTSSGELTHSAMGRMIKLARRTRAD